MPELWYPGAEGPIEQFVDRLHRRIESFAGSRGIAQAAVDVELTDGALLSVKAISADPGLGFITICPYPEEADGEDEELIVPLGSIRRITLRAAAEKRGRLGFALPDAPA